jgi:hypothetical protein
MGRFFTKNETSFAVLLCDETACMFLTKVSCLRSSTQLRCLKRSMSIHANRAVQTLLHGSYLAGSLTEAGKSNTYSSIHML